MVVGLSPSPSPSLALLTQLDNTSGLTVLVTGWMSSSTAGSTTAPLRAFVESFVLLRQSDFYVVTNDLLHFLDLDKSPASAAAAAAGVAAAAGAGAAPVDPVASLIAEASAPVQSAPTPAPVSVPAPAPVSAPVPASTARPVPLPIGSKKNKAGSPPAPVVAGVAPDVPAVVPVLVALVPEAVPAPVVSSESVVDAIEVRWWGWTSTVLF